MTEQEWLACTDPEKMLMFLREKASERKLRLFACGCARHHCRIFEESAEQEAYYRRIKPEADALCFQIITLIEEHDNREERWERCTPLRDQLTQIAPIGLNWDIAATIGGDAGYWVSHVPIPATARQQAMMDAALLKYRHEMMLLQTRLLRDLFGNPFRPVALDPAWLAWSDCTIPKLAQAIYDDRTIDRLPILADALEKAGCDNTDILTHCRSDGPHVRGCWGIDLILGKS